MTEGWLHDTLEQLIEQIRTLLDVTGVAFVTIDEDRAAIRPAAAWFATPEASRAFTPLLARPYDAERGGVTEAAVESGTAVLIPRLGDWPGAERLRERIGEGLGAGARRPRVGLLLDRVVHLRARAHRGRPHVRRARDLLQPAAARALRRGPAVDRGLRAARGARARALRAAGARGRAAPRGGAAQPRAAGRRGLDRPRGRLPRDRRAGGGAERRHDGDPLPLRPRPRRAAPRRGHRRLRADGARALPARGGDDRARRRDRRALRVDARRRVALPPLGGRDGGRRRRSCTCRSRSPGGCSAC